MKNYEHLNLAPLPAPWFWKKGQDDGDPTAVLERDGWRVTVHEAMACEYSDHLAITTRNIAAGDGLPPFGVPFPVFKAVHLALRQWYGIDAGEVTET
jgi:hypothetical protein